MDLLTDIESLQIYTELMLVSTDQAFLTALDKSVTVKAIGVRMSEDTAEIRRYVDLVTKLLDATFTPGCSHPYDTVVAAYVYAIEKADSPSARRLLRRIRRENRADMSWTTFLANYLASEEIVGEETLEPIEAAYRAYHDGHLLVMLSLLEGIQPGDAGYDRAQEKLPYLIGEIEDMRLSITTLRQSLASVDTPESDRLNATVNLANNLLLIGEREEPRKLLLPYASKDRRARRLLEKYLGIPRYWWDLPAQVTELIHSPVDDPRWFAANGVEHKSIQMGQEAGHTYLILNETAGTSRIRRVFHYHGEARVGAQKGDE